MSTDARDEHYILDDGLGGDMVYGRRHKQGACWCGEHHGGRPPAKDYVYGSHIDGLHPGHPVGHVYIHNLRTEGDMLTGFITFSDKDGTHALTIPTSTWEQLGSPAYVVVMVRPETFGESTP